MNSENNIDSSSKSIPTTSCFPVLTAHKIAVFACVFFAVGSLVAAGALYYYLPGFDPTYIILIAASSPLFICGALVSYQKVQSLKRAQSARVQKKPDVQLPPPSLAPSLSVIAEEKPAPEAPKPKNPEPEVPPLIIEKQPEEPVIPEKYVREKLEILPSSMERIPIAKSIEEPPVVLVSITTDVVISEGKKEVKQSEELIKGFAEWITTEFKEETFPERTPFLEELIKSLDENDELKWVMAESEFYSLRSHPTKSGKKEVPAFTRQDLVEVFIFHLSQFWDDCTKGYPEGQVEKLFKL